MKIYMIFQVKKNIKKNLIEIENYIARKNKMPTQLDT